MAMQKSKRSRSRRGAGRAHFFAVPKTWSVVKDTGEVTPSHKVSASGYFKGKKIMKTKDEKKAERASAAEA